MLAARNSFRRSPTRNPGPRRSAVAMPAVTQSINALYRIEVRIERGELAADAFDVRRDGAVVDGQAGFAHERVAILDVSREFCERMHDPEFGQRELDLTLRPVRLHALEVEPESSALQHVLGL